MQRRNRILVVLCSRHKVSLGRKPDPQSNLSSGNEILKTGYHLAVVFHINTQTVRQNGISGILILLFYTLAQTPALQWQTEYTHDYRGARGRPSTTER